MFDFSTVTEPSTSEYVNKPGYYTAKITNTTYTDPDDPNKNPYINVTFETKHGKIEEKFYITAKALHRLKTLFNGVFQKELDKTFNNALEVGNFFIAMFKKEREVLIKVIGERNTDTGKVYHKLPFFNFIEPDLSTFEEVQIEPTDPNYNAWVFDRKSTAPATNAAVVPPAPAPAKTNWDSVGDESDDLPF